MSALSELFRSLGDWLLPYSPLLIAIGTLASSFLQVKKFIKKVNETKDDPKALKKILISYSIYFFYAGLLLGVAILIEFALGVSMVSTRNRVWRI